MIKKYSLFAFIIFTSHHFIYSNTYGAPVAYTISNPLTPLDPTGDHLSNPLEPLHKTNGIPTRQNKNGISSRVMDTYKRNLDEAMGKKTTTTSKSTSNTSNGTSVVTTTDTIPTQKSNDKIKKTTTDKPLKTETSTDIKKTETSSHNALPPTNEQKINQKIEDKKTTTTNEEKEQKSLNNTDKKPEQEDQKPIEKINTHKDASATLYDQKNFKKDTRKQVYEGARPQLWYGGPWHRG